MASLTAGFDWSVFGHVSWHVTIVGLIMGWADCGQP